MTPLDLLLLGAVALVAWLLLIRPAKVRRDAQLATESALAPGVRVMTTAGLFGTVRSVDRDRVTLEIAPGVVVEMVPQAVGRILDEAPVAGQDPAAQAGSEQDPPQAAAERDDVAEDPPGGRAATGTEEADRG
jgi:preprotein translocase subunit YajC